MDEQFEGEDPVDENLDNATQRRMREEGTIWHDVEGNPAPGNPGAEPERHENPRPERGD